MDPRPGKPFDGAGEMLIQEAFLRALDELEHEHQKPHLDARNLKVVHTAIRGCSAESHGPPSEIEEAKLFYSARRLARRWCSYARPCRDRTAELNLLRDEWVVFARQLATLSSVKAALTLWEMARAMKPEDVKHDAERGQYLMRQAMTHPVLFEGLTSSVCIPWPGPASFFVHAVEELEGASAGERLELHRFLEEQEGDEAVWLIHAVVQWLRARYESSIE